MATISQGTHRWRNDDGSQTTATWPATEDSPFSGTLATNYRLRIQTLLLGLGSVTWTPQLQYNKNGAGWNNVAAASSVARSSASSNVADSAATTMQLSTSSSPFGAGVFDEVDGLGSSVTLDDAANVFTEHEFCFQIRSADVTAGDQIQFRLIKSPATAYDGYQAAYPTFVVGGATAANGSRFFLSL